MRPAASPLISKRREIPENAASARAESSKLMPSSRATAIAASELSARWRPGDGISTVPRGSPLRITSTRVESPSIKIFRVDIGHDSHGGKQQQEGGIAFVGLGHHEVATTEAHIGAACAQVSADCDGRVETRLLHDEADERSRRRFAVGASDRDSEAGEAQQFTEHLGARDYRDFHRTGGADFGIREFYGGGDYDGVEVRAQMTRMVAVINPDTEGQEPCSGRTSIQVASAHREAEPLT